MPCCIKNFDNGEMALRFLTNNTVDVVLIDHQLKGLSGSETIRRLLRFKPETKVLVISAIVEYQFIIEVMEAGAHGFMKENISQHQLLEGIQAVMRNKKYYCNETAMVMIEAAEVSPAKILIAEHHLTSRELEVLQLIADGLSNKKIAEKLFLGIRTIETHRYKLMIKLNVHHTGGLVRLAMEKGLLNLVNR